MCDGPLQSTPIYAELPSFVLPHSACREGTLAKKGWSSETSCLGNQFAQSTTRPSRLLLEDKYLTNTDPSVHSMSRALTKPKGYDMPRLYIPNSIQQCVLFVAGPKLHHTRSRSLAVPSTQNHHPTLLRRCCLIAQLVQLLSSESPTRNTKRLHCDHQPGQRAKHARPINDKKEKQ